MKSSSPSNCDASWRSLLSASSPRLPSPGLSCYFDSRSVSFRLYIEVQAGWFHDVLSSEVRNISCLDDVVSLFNSVLNLYAFDISPAETRMFVKCEFAPSAGSTPLTLPLSLFDILSFRFSPFPKCFAVRVLPSDSSYCSFIDLSFPDYASFREHLFGSLSLLGMNIRVFSFSLYVVKSSIDFRSFSRADFQCPTDFLPRKICL